MWTAVKDIPGFGDRYRITSDGRVWSKPSVRRGVTGRWGSSTEYTRCVPGRFLKPARHGAGYPVVTLDDGTCTRTGRRAYVHRLVASAFVPKDNANHDIVNHIDEDPTNPHFSNLEWTDKSGNFLHTFNRSK